ncbi:alpha-2-macroglobulin [Aplochiton taeniatus]
MDFYECVQFKVPPVSLDTVATLHVSVQGEKDSMAKKSKILLSPAAFINIIQTDKPIYKPGQTVQFRIVSMSSSFVAENQKYKTVELQDPNSNRIAQWLDRTPVSGILDLSLPMSPEAAQGSYIIRAWKEDGRQISHTFDIKEYVLPKFEVKVHLPNMITILDTGATLRVCGKYTYGKPVLGSVKATVCRKAFSWSWYTGSTAPSEICQTYELTGQYRPDVKLEPYVRNLRRPFYKSAYISAPVFYSKSKSFVKMMQADEKFTCDSDVALRVQYIVQGDELSHGQENLGFFYMVMSRGSVVQHGRLTAAVKRGTENKGVLTLSLKDMADLAPVAQVVVYTVMPNGETVADSMDFPIQPCLKNKVSLSFSSEQALPAEKTSLKLQAHPGSLCSLRAIDQSVLLLKKEQELSVDSLFAQLPVQKMDGYSYVVEDYEPYPCLSPEIDPPMMEEEEPAPARRKRSYYFGPVDEKNDVYSTFKDVGIKILTNSDVKKPYDCNRRIAMAYEGEQDLMDTPDYDAEDMSEPTEGLAKDGTPKETVRTYFPETWIWDLLPVGATGSVTVEKEVPDTITKWAAGAFCTSPDVGLGLAPNVGLIAFQPFFVSLTLPYSVIRGEVFTLKATVFNYLTTCIMVKVTLPESQEFTSRECDGCQYTLCLCGEESRTFHWIVTPTSLGEIRLKVSAEALKTDQLCGNEVATVPEKGRLDTVIRTLLVEAEGTPVYFSNNALLCPTEGPVEKDIPLQMPEMFVAGSAKASVSILGDLMGRAMKNLDSLLAMPYGCGEQNMVLFAPNIYILNYLQSTRQLTKEIKDKATHFLKSGYQRELNYKHEDGSYSAFGMSDASGNTWLTAFVMKSFGGAQPFIFVDPHHIHRAKTWLLRQQREDGCFNSVGKLFHNGMKGGVSDDVSLTAYITAALLELNADPIFDPMVQKGLSCLKAAVAGQQDNTYTTALFSYTFSLAGDQETRTKLLTYLDKKAKTQGGTRHWVRTGASSEKLDSLEVEMTSYVLLALLSGPTLPGFGLDYSASIVRWLVQQQNSFGGFASTQDTVVALQALAKYGAATYSSEGATTVTVTSAGGLKKQYTVDQSNRLLYQEDPLSDVPGEYKVMAVGQSCVFVQISMRYNIPPPPDYSAFNISVVTLADCALPKPQLTVAISVRYNGRREETNMVIINVKLLSGFILDKSSLENLKLDSTVKRVDVDEGYVNVYLDGLRRDEIKWYNLKIEQDVKVRNLKPAVVKIYDYYQTSKTQPL